MDDTGTGYGELRAADVVRLVVWVLGVGGLVVYSLITPNRSAGLAYGVAIVVGIAFGLPRSRWPAVQVFAPLLLFGVGGFLASSHFSNTRGYDGGDWSVAAIVMLAAVLSGIAAIIVAGATVFARDALRHAWRRLLPRQSS